jgi:hypothetical protein
MSSQYIFTDENSIVRQMQQIAKNQFALERADILLHLPTSYKQRFGSMAFLVETWVQPVLLVSPYDVPPGPLRAMWMEWFLEVRMTSIVRVTV